MSYKSSRLNLYDSTNFTQVFEIKNELDKVSYNSIGQSEFNSTSITFVKKDGQGATVSSVIDAVSVINDNVAAISAETASRIAADSVLDGKISDETNARVSADNDLDAKISTEKGRIDAILNGSDVNLDTFNEVVTYVNSLDATQLNLLQSQQAQITQLTTDLAALTAVVESLIPGAGRGGGQP